MEVEALSLSELFVFGFIIIGFIDAWFNVWIEAWLSCFGELEEFIIGCAGKDALIIAVKEIK